VDVDEFEKLFTLLDEDGSGDIDNEEFMFGCLSLKGEAKTLHLAILQRDVDSLNQEAMAHHALSKQKLSRVHTLDRQCSSGGNQPEHVALLDHVSSMSAAARTCTCWSVYTISTVRLRCIILHRRDI